MFQFASKSFHSLAFHNFTRQGVPQPSRNVGLISKTSLWIFAKFIADTPYVLSCKLLTFDADHI